MSTSPVLPVAAPVAVVDPLRTQVWTWGHVVVLLICWGPLNPLVVNVARWAAFGDPGPTWDLATWREFGGWVLASWLGPFTAVTEGRNVPHCLAFGWHAMPICGSAILLASLVQMAWRPMSKTRRVLRLVLWGSAWLVWFGAAFVSILNNSG